MVKQNKILLILFSLLLIISACKEEDPSEYENLTLLTKNVVIIPETSGLSFFRDDLFMTVSDSLKNIYIINYNGLYISEIGFSGDNLEGVTFDPESSFIYVVEENSNEVVKLDTNGNEILRFDVPLNNENKKHGLEGISIDPATGNLFVVSEKNPSMLFEYTNEGEIVGTGLLSFALDYSSVFFEANEQMLWILSDDSETITKTTLEGVAIKTYGTGIKKGEGVVVDIENSIIYVISDSDSFLYKFSL